jgi:hypothetical protein
MAKLTKISVVLTKEGREALSGEPFYKLTVTKNGDLICQKVEEHGYFQRLTLSLPPEGGKVLNFEVDLPSHYVLYMMTAVSEARRQLGFKGE